MTIRRALPGLFLPLILLACGARGTGRSPAPAVPAAPPGPPVPAADSLPFPPENLAAVLRPGEQPLWFEVSAGPPAPEAPAGTTRDGAALGPRHIQSPALADLAPFTPWPLAPHVAAMLPLGEALYLAVNRDSLLALIPREGGDLELYRFAGTEYWSSYTVGTLLAHKGAPALFFYRDDTFAEPTAPPPDPPVLALFPGLLPPAAGTGPAFSPPLGPLELPALGDIPFAEGWEADILRPGTDGLWYYRGIRRKNGGRETRYFRSPSLSRGGEEIDAAAYRNSQAPGGEPGETAAGTPPLPPLPEQFVYTHTGRLGDLVIAAWEEQDQYSIGASGFMVFREP